MTCPRRRRPALLRWGTEDPAPRSQPGRRTAGRSPRHLHRPRRPKSHACDQRLHARLRPAPTPPRTMIVLSSEKVAERVRVGFPQVLVVAEAEEAGPGGEVGGDVRGDDPAAVDLPGVRWQGPLAHGLPGPDAAGLPQRVLAARGIHALGAVAVRDSWG